MKAPAWRGVQAVAIVAWVCLAWSPPAAADKAGPDVQVLVAEALANNPELKASEEQWRMMVARAEQADALEDPMVMVRIQNGLLRDPLAFDRDGMTAKVIGISQTIPFYGKRDLMKEAADQGADAERWTVEERRLSLQRLVKENWLRMYQVDRSLETVNGTIVLVNDLIRLAESQYGVGATVQQEVFQAQLQRSKMEEMRILLQEQRQSLTTVLNALAARPQTVSYPTLPLLKPTSHEFVAVELERLAIDNRPALQAMRARIDGSDAEIRLARREFYPDFTVGVEYMQREATMGSNGDDMYGAQLSFNLPIQQERRHAKVAEMEAQRRKGLWELEEAKNQIRQAIGESLARLVRSQQRLRLYEQGILVQAGAAAESALAAYRTGAVGFSEVLAARMQQFGNEQSYHGTVADQHMQLAVLENMVGRTLPSRIDSSPDLKKTKKGGQ